MWKLDTKLIGVQTAGLGVPELQIKEEEDFVHLYLGDQHEVFSAYGATRESLREAAREMIRREAQFKHPS